MTNESKALRSIFCHYRNEEENGSYTDPNIERAAVLGGGLMGAGISHVSVAKAKVPVRIKDVSNDGVLNALKYNYKLFEKQRKRRILSKAQLQSRCYSCQVVLTSLPLTILTLLSKPYLKIYNSRWLQM